MTQVIEEYGMMILEAVGGAVALGAIGFAFKMLTEHGYKLLQFVF
jgi:hypothetical protein